MAALVLGDNCQWLSFRSSCAGPLQRVSCISDRGQAQPSKWMEAAIALGQRRRAWGWLDARFAELPFVQMGFQYPSVPTHVYLSDTPWLFAVVDSDPGYT